MSRRVRHLSCILLPGVLLLGLATVAHAQTTTPAVPAPAAVAVVPPAPAPTAQLTVTPPVGPSEQSVRIEAKGLPANAQAVLLGGQDPAALQQINTVTVDPSGAITIMAEIPGGAEYDREFLFTLAIDGQPAATGAYRVGSRTAPAN